MSLSLSPLADRLARFVVRRRVLILAATVLVVLLSLPLALRVPYDASSDIWFLESDPAQQAWNRCQEIFGTEVFVLVFTEVPEGTVYRNDLLASVERVTSRLERLPQVRRAGGVTRYESFHGEGDLLTTGRVIPPLPASPPALEDAARRLESDPAAVPSVVTADGRLTSILVEFAPGLEDFQERLDLLRTIRETLAEETAASGVVYELTGEPVLNEDLFMKSRRDLLVLFPLAALVITALLALTTRSLPGTLIPLALVLGAVSISRALIPLLGWRDNGLLAVLPLVILTVGIADSVHIVMRFLVRRQQLRESAAAASAGVRELFKPCLLTTLTTAVGFASLATAGLVPLRQLGVIAAAGVTAALAVSLLSLPAALSLLPPAGAARVRRRGPDLLTRALEALPAVVARRRVSILAMAAALTLAAAAGLPRLKVESNTLAYFDRHDPVRVRGEYAESRVGGLSTLETLITTDRPGGVRDPRVLSGMERLERYLESQELVTGAASLVDPLRAAHRALHGDDPAFDRIPEDPALIAQLLLLSEAASEGAGLEGLVDLPQRHARVWARVKFASSTAYETLRRDVEAAARDLFPPGTTVEVTGIVTLFAKMGDLIVLSQIRSFLLAMALITLTLVLAFGSLRLGLLSLIPNMWPIALTAGIMGWAGIRLDPGNAMVAAVAIGIAVDDTVHFIHAYREKLAAGETEGDPVRAAFRASGRAIVATTVILLGGFAVTLGSEFRLAAHFGGLCMTALFLALVGDLLILPALVRSRARG